MRVVSARNPGWEPRCETARQLLAPRMPDGLPDAPDEPGVQVVHGSAERSKERDQLLEQISHWTPEAQERALELIRQREQNPWRPFYCPRPDCDGEPHDVWVWNHARADQHPPPMSDSEWLVWLLMGGRGGGKTRTGAEASHRMAKKVPRMHLIAPTGPDLRETMVEGESGLQATAPPDFMPQWEPSKKKLTWPNGAIALGFSGEEPDRLRGPQCFVAGTMIHTATGEVPIEAITPGTLVWTRYGLRPVARTNNSMAEVITVEHDSGTLTGTREHPVMTTRGWTWLGLIDPGVMLQVWDGRSTRPTAAPIATKAVSTSFAPAGCGNSTMAPFPTAGTFTTVTMTAWTTESTTSSPYRPTITAASTSKNPPRTPAPRAAASSSKDGEHRDGSAPTAAPSAHASSNAEPTSGARTAPSPASSAEPSSSLELERSVVRRASTGGVLARVYNLTVANTPEYFANGVLVHNCHWVWIDEPATMPLIDGDNGVWNNMLFGLRLGRRPWICATTTPRPTKWMKSLVGDEMTRISNFSTYANLKNLAPSFKRTILNKFEGTRVGQQELYGKVLTTVVGALWQNEWIAYLPQAPSTLVRVIVAIDPAGTANKKSDETGIIVLAVDDKGCIIVLQDLTAKYSPSGWATAAVAAYHHYSADAIVAEVNYGGDMVKEVLDKNGAKDIKIIKVTSRRGKAIRAEPIAALYERGFNLNLPTVFHLQGKLEELEGELASWVPGHGDSPNRLDALVHGATELAKNVQPADVSVPSAATMPELAAAMPGLAHA